MARIVQQIIFNNEYPKLHNEKYGVLVAVINDISSEILKTKWAGLLRYDTLRSDGRFFAIQDGNKYMLLLFVSDNGFLIPTLRKQNKENSEKYNLLVGDLFEFVIIEEK